MGAGLSLVMLSEAGKLALLDAAAGTFGHPSAAYKELKKLGAIEKKREGLTLTLKGQEMAGKLRASRAIR